MYIYIQITIFGKSGIFPNFTAFSNIQSEILQNETKMNTHTVIANSLFKASNLDCMSSSVICFFNGGLLLHKPGGSVMSHTIY